MIEVRTRTERVTAWLRRPPIDLIAFVVIGVALVLIRRPLLRHGLCFNDSAWYFHFGHRALAGDVPYRDYVFQVGPLPIYVDALFQKIFGAKYMASYFASLAILIARVFVIWLLARRLAGWKAAALLCVFCGLDHHFAWAHHWSWAYAQLFIATSGLCFVLAERAASERRSLTWLGLAGFAAGMVVSARQATVVTVAMILFVATIVMTVRKQGFTWRRFAVLWGGFAAAFVIVFGLLAMAGALGPAIQQIFLDAPEKKSISGLNAGLDAISGGSLVMYQTPWWRGLLRFLTLPGLAVAGTIYLASRPERSLSLRAVALVLVPAGIVLGLMTRDAEMFYYADPPRTLFTVMTFVAIAWPDRTRRWFGVSPLLVVAFAGFALASDWALEMSYPGRGWGDWPALLTGAIMLALASTRITARMKTGICAAFAIAGVTHFTMLLYNGINPIMHPAATDGLLSETVGKSPSPILRGMLVSQSRVDTVGWLSSKVTPGSTCFVYGTVPILYDILRCTNPTRVDVTIPDFLTVRDADEAIATLRAAPPDFLIAQETSFMNPPLTADLEGKIEVWSEVNSAANKAIFLGLKHLLDQYDDLGRVSDNLDPELAKQASGHWDTHQAIRLYRRKSR